MRFIDSSGIETLAKATKPELAQTAGRALDRGLRR
jgi:hypothetical protein